MGSSNIAKLAVGVPIDAVLEYRTERRIRDRFDSDTGERYTFEYDQLVYTVCGVDIPVNTKDILAEDRPKLGYSVGFYHWLLERGFCNSLLRYSHTKYDHVPPNGILGISVWDYKADHADTSENYGYTFRHREVYLPDVNERLEQVKFMLEKIGCNIEPKCYVVIH